MASCVEPCVARDTPRGTKSTKQCVHRSAVNLVRTASVPLQSTVLVVEVTNQILRASTRAYRSVAKNAVTASASSLKPAPVMTATGGTLPTLTCAYPHARKSARMDIAGKNVQLITTKLRQCVVKIASTASALLLKPVSVTKDSKSWKIPSTCANHIVPKNVTTGIAVRQKSVLAIPGF